MLLFVVPIVIVLKHLRITNNPFRLPPSNSYELVQLPWSELPNRSVFLQLYLREPGQGLNLCSVVTRLAKLKIVASLKNSSFPDRFTCKPLPCGKRLIKSNKCRFRRRVSSNKSRYCRLEAIHSLRSFRETGGHNWISKNGVIRSIVVQTVSSFGMYNRLCG